MRHRRFSLVEQPAKIPAFVSGTISTDSVEPSGLGASQVLSESSAVLKNSACANVVRSRAFKQQWITIYPCLVYDEQTARAFAKYASNPKSSTCLTMQSR